MTAGLIDPDQAGAAEVSTVNVDTGGALNPIVDSVERVLAEEKFRLAVEACPDGMVMVDGHGKMVMVNTEVERQFAYGREELIGQCLEMLVPARLRSKHARYRDAFNHRPERRQMRTFDRDLFGSVSYTHLTLPTNREV